MQEGIANLSCARALQAFNEKSAEVRPLSPSSCFVSSLKVSHACLLRDVASSLHEAHSQTVTFWAPCPTLCSSQASSSPSPSSSTAASAFRPPERALPPTCRQWSHVNHSSPGTSRRTSSRAASLAMSLHERAICNRKVGLNCSVNPRVACCRDVTCRAVCKPKHAEEASRESLKRGHPDMGITIRT